MSQQPEKHSLKDLVVKLNDRNIQRQRESGLTVYAMVGAIIYIVFELIKSTPNFVNVGHRVDNIIILTIIADSALPLGYFLIFIFGKRSSGLTKIFPKDDFLSFDPSFVPYLTFFVLSSILNFYSLTHSKSTSYIYVFFGMIFILNFVSPIAIKLFQWIKNRGSKLRVPEFTYLKPKQASFAKVLTLFYGTILSFVIVALIFSERVEMSNKEIAEIVKDGFCVVGLFFAIAIMVDMIEQRNHNERLEELEKEIFLNGLTSEEIKTRLEEEYFGQDFKAWASVRMIGTSNYFKPLIEEHIRSTTELQSLLDSLSEDTNAGRLIHENTKSREAMIKDVVQYDKDFKKQIKHLKNFSSIDNEEMQTLIELQNHYNKELEALGKVDERWQEQYQRVPKVTF